jgi:two-component system, cell cycle sensor histidine kinase and response regulator CckA
MTEERKYPSRISIADASLKNILDASPVGLIVFDHEARVIYANTLAEQLFGTSASSDDVRKFGDFIACAHRHTDAQGCGQTDHCQSCPLFRAMRAVGEKEPNTADLEGEALLLREPEQSDLWVKFKVNGIPMGDRKAAIMMIDDITDRRRSEKAVRDSHQDITGRKLAEDALRESEQKYREIFENAPVGIFQTTPQGRFLSANPEYARMAGYSTPSEMIARISNISAELYVRPEERKRYKELLQQHGQVRDYAVELRRRDGSTFWVSMNAKALKIRDGSIVYDGFLTDVTERVRAEQALRNAEARQRAMIANIADVIAIIDQDGIIRFKSANIEKWFGWRSEDLLGTLAWDNVHPEDLDGALKMYAELLAEPNGMRTVESRYRCKDGTYKWTSFAAVNLLHNPDIKGFLLNYRDITDSKRAKVALMESESRLALAMDAVSDGIWDWRVDSGKVYYSPRWYLMLGYEPYELPQEFETWQNLLHPDDRSRAEQNIAKYLETTEPFEMEFRMSTRQGGWKWILARGRTVERNMDGEALRMLGTHVDITERKQAEDALRESERHLQQVFDILPVGLWFADKEGTLLKGNPAGIKIWGAQPLVDPSRYGIFKARRFPSGEEIAPGDWSLYHTIRGGVTIVDELLEIDAFDGEKRVILNSTAPVLDEQGNVQGAIVVNQDVTDRKRAEVEKEKLQSQLNQAQKMESVGRLAGGVAHDYNNMLSVIMGYTEMAMDKMRPDHPLHADLTEIFKAARRSIDITRQLLAFARKQTIAPRVVDLNAIVESMLRMLGRLIGENIDLAWLPGKHLWSVKIDPAQIDQILANLCVNARDAIGGVGKVTIETGNTTIDGAYCELHAGFLPGEFVSLAISDNGCGMDEQIVKNIFEPFFTTKGVAEGTGLGLATVYGIVKQNNGYINVYSEPGSGTTFRIYLPRHVGEQHQMRVASNIQTPMGRGEMVLLVEDEPSIMRMAKMMLKRLDYQVLAAGTPRQALALAEQHAGAIDLLITDVVMPEMSGRNLANQIHALYPSIKTLFMSGYTANVIAHNGVLDEGVNFIQKPFSHNDLAIKIRSVLKE